MNLELLNLIIIGLGMIITLLVNWEKLVKAPHWLIGFLIGAVSGFMAGMVM